MNIPRNNLKKITKPKTDGKFSPRRKKVPIPISVSSSTSSLIDTNNNMRVVVRVRPPNEKEGGNNAKCIIKIFEPTELIFDPKEDSTPFFYHGVQQKVRDLNKRAHKHMKFVFDSVFGFESSNEEIFKDSTKNLIQSLMDGYNCSVFVYGATGAGKTYTMLGNNSCPGITFLTMEELFAQKQALSSERDFDLGISYLEVYNELVQDLLVPGKPLHLREDGKFGVIVSGIQIKRIIKAEELFSLLVQGNKNRTQHPTDANAESSRSHAVFQVYIRMNIRKTGEVRVSKLSMIDLAGSERGAATGCSGARFIEGANINKSLLALGNCINSLADKKSHIPYRDSKLTRLLKDSLGGNCRTVMIANVSPSSLTYDDTFNTLKYATRAKQIKYSMKKNIVNNVLQASQYQKIVEDLSKEVEQLKNELTEVRSEVFSEKQISNQLQIELEETKTELISAQNKLLEICHRSSIHENSHSSMEEDVEPVHSPFASPTMRTTTVSSVLSKTITVSSSCNEATLANSALLKEVMEMVREREIVQERLLTFKNQEQLLVERAKIKRDADSRLSGICFESPEREEGHKRLRGTVDSLQRQAGNLQFDADKFQKTLDDLDLRISQVFDNVDDKEIKFYINHANTKLEKLKAELHVKHLQKLLELRVNETKMRDDLLEKMANVLQPCYLTLRGEGKASHAIIKQYRLLTKQIIGIRSITWDEHVTTTTFADVPQGHSSPKPLSKNTISMMPPCSPLENTKTDECKLSELNNTFTLQQQMDSSAIEDVENIPVKVLTPKNNKINRSALGECILRDNVTTKVFKQPPPFKQRAVITSTTPRVKDNKIVKVRPVGTMGTSQRFPLYQSPNTRTASSVIRSTSKGRLPTTSPSSTTNLQRRRKIL